MNNILYLHAGAEMYGADRVLLDLIKRIDKKKYTPHVILPETGILERELRNLGIKVKVIPYPIMRRKYFTPVGIIRYFLSLIKYCKVISKYAKENNISLIHSNTAATIEGGIVAKKIKVPHLWSIHEIIIKPKVMYRFTSYIISKWSNLVITDSIAVKKHLMNSKKFLDKKIKVIHNGVDSSRFNPEVSCDYLFEEFQIPNKAIIIGMMGRINSWKGQLDFLKAANIVMKNNPNVFTIFIGSAFRGEEWREEELALKILESPFKDRIRNYGYRKDSQAIYKMLDVFVLPSINPDPFPTVVLEAMATGKPIVAYNHGGVCEMVVDGENGFLVEVGNVTDLAEKITNIIKNDDVRKRMEKKSRERLMKLFSMDSYISNYSRIYGDLLRETSND